MMLIGAAAVTLLFGAAIAAPKLDADGHVDAQFLKAHRSFLARAAAGPVGVLFIGDSITAGWFWDGNKEIWDHAFGRYQPANFGIGGDRTQHVLWRIEHGELDHVRPRVVVLLIGTNNIGDPESDIVAGVKAIAASIHRKLPQSKLLLLGIFPRSSDRRKIREVNATLAKLDDRRSTRFLDIGDRFLSPDGTPSPDIMPDGLHLSRKGYEIWAAAMAPLLEETLGVTPPAARTP